MQIVGLDRRDHVGLIRLTAHSNATDATVLGHESSRGHLSRPTGQDANQADAPIYRQSGDRLRQIAGSAHLYDQVHPRAAGELKRLFSPFCMGFVIDQMLRAECTEALELGIRG